MRNCEYIIFEEVYVSLLHQVMWQLHVCCFLSFSFIDGPNRKNLGIFFKDLQHEHLKVHPDWPFKMDSIHLMAIG